jgi:hypothetical protein
MQKRAVRLSLLALLVVTGLGAAFVAWDTHIKIRGGLAREREVDARLDRMSAATASLGASQQAYVAPGQQRGDALTHASVVVQQLYDAIGALRLTARSTEAAGALLSFGQALDTLVNVDDRAREHLREEQQLMTADLVYTEARQAIAEMHAQLDALRKSESRFSETERTGLLARLGSVVGGVTIVWLAVALALVRVPAARSGAPAVVSSDTLVDENAPSATPATSRSVDLNAAAAVCTELSRLTSAAALPPALRRAARVLDAPGVIVWLGAGEELFPASAHGYGPRALARLGPIPRGGDNAAAAAWRTAQSAIVESGDGANGAIVAPLVGRAGCFGVLTAEVRHGREKDEATRAVAAMIAAQLSAVVAPWPGPSEVEESAAEGAGGTEDRPAEPAGSQRTAASA